jgi:cytochrome c oxidase subunit III
MAPATTLADEVVIIDAGHSGGGNSASGHGGDGGDDGSGGWEGEFSGPHVPQRAYVTGMTVALAGILMFFMALVSAFIVRKGFPNSGWQPLAPPPILWFNTAVLVVSSVTIAFARRRLEGGKLASFRAWWWLTTGLGLLFLGGQIVAWRQLLAQGVYVTTNPSSSFFYLFTAAHGLHLLGGVIALVAVAVREPRHLTRSTAVEVTGIYWHFMDGLWVFLFLILFLGR